MRFAAVLFLTCSSLMPVTAGAAPKTAKAAEPKSAPRSEAAEAPADKPRRQPLVGPREVKLPHDLTIDLPADYLLFGQPDAGDIMREMGNVPSDRLLAIVAKDDSSWFVTVSFWDEGYVKDDEAQKLDADEILDSIREGTEAANEERKKMGSSPIHVDRWTEPPRYEAPVHHLVWGIQGSTDKSKVINFNTRVLGRHGYASLNLIDAADTLEAAKPHAATLLAATHFEKGARYEDFDAGKDKVAEYGLAALVAGGAGAAALKVAKVGLLAKFGGKLLALLIAGKKVVIVGVIALGAALKKLFGRRDG